MELDYTLSIPTTELDRATVRLQEPPNRDSCLSIISYSLPNVKVGANWTSCRVAGPSSNTHWSLGTIASLQESDLGNHDLYNLIDFHERYM